MIYTCISCAWVCIVAIVVFLTRYTSFDGLVVAPIDWIAEVVRAVVAVVAVGRITARTLRLLAGAVFGTCVSIIAQCAIG